MNGYDELLKLYYLKQNIEEEAKKRIENPCAYKTSLEINPILKD